MAAITISVAGVEDVERNMDTIRRATMPEAASALFTEAELIMKDIKQGHWIPKDTGALETSGRVENPIISESRVSVLLGFGGPAIPYALIQHEAQHFNHPGQGQAKYLEAPLRLWAPRTLRPIAERIRRMWARGMH